MLKNALVGYRFQGAATWPPFCLPSSPSWTFLYTYFFILIQIIFFSHLFSLSRARLRTAASSTARQAPILRQVRNPPSVKLLIFSSQASQQCSSSSQTGEQYPQLDWYYNLPQPPGLFYLSPLSPPHFIQTWLKEPFAGQIDKPYSMSQVAKVSQGLHIALQYGVKLNFLSLRTALVQGAG